MQLNLSSIKMLFANLHFNVDDNPNEMVFIGIRGSQVDKYVNQVDSLEAAAKNIVSDTYCCTILQVYQNKIAGFLASTLPGNYYEQNPENPEGVARLLPGLFLFNRGVHMGHEAFVQGNNVFIILRDTNKNEVFDYDSDYFQAGAGWGIDIHSGGGYPNVARNSAGCNIIRGDKDSNGNWRGWDSVPWTTFKSKAYSATNNIYKYILIPYGWIENILNGSQYCMYGSSGDRVKIIQSKLGLNADGNYGVETTKAVMQFQGQNSIQKNGIVGPQTALAMGV